MESVEPIRKKKPTKNPLVNDSLLIVVSFVVPTIIGLIIDIKYLYNSVYLGGPTLFGFFLFGPFIAFTWKEALMRREIESAYE